MNYIICPHCGAEYTPAEIYIPSALIKNPGHIVRDDNNKILETEYSPLDLTESFICDFCNKEFVVEASISFSTYNSKEHYYEDYSTKLNKTKLFLNEE